LRKLFLLAALLPCSIVLFGAQIETWNLDASDDWGDPGAWTPVGFPNGFGATANFGAVITQPRTVTVDQPTFIVGFLTFDNANAYTIDGFGSQLIIDSGQVGVPSTFNITNVNGNGAHRINSTVQLLLDNDLIITQGSTSPVTLACFIGGFGASNFTLNAPVLTNTLIVSASNPNQLGSVTINSGILQCGAINIFGFSSFNVNASGTLQLTSFNQTVNALSGSGSVDLGTATLNVNTSGSNAFSGVLSNTGSLTVSGSGSLTLTGGNTYSNGTTIAGTATLIGNTNSLQGNIVDNSLLIFNQTTDGSFTSVVSGSGSLIKQGAAKLTLTGLNSYGGTTTVTAGTLQGSTTTLPGPITNNAALIFDQALTGTFSPVISGSGTVEKQNAGTLILTGANTFAGTTTITAGTLQGSTTSLPSAIVDNAILVFNQTATGTFSHAITGSGSFTKLGVGTLILLGGNTYSGGTTVSAGTLQGNTTSLQGAITDNATLTFDQASPGTFASAISGSGQLIKIGIGSLILTGPNIYGGGTTISAGSMEGNTTSLQGAITDNAALVFNQVGNGTFASLISGSGNMLKIGVGDVVLSVANTYSGGTTINDGTITVGIVNALPSGQELAMNSPGGLVLSTFNQNIGQLSGTGTIFTGNSGAVGLTVNVPVSVINTYSGDISGSGSLTSAGAGTFIVLGTNTYTGGTTVSAGTLQGNTTSLQGAITDNASLIFNQFSPGAFSSIISGSGKMVKTGVGSLDLTASNLYSGGTTINAGTLAIGAVNALLPAGSVAVNSPGGLVLTTFNQTITGLSGNGQITLGVSGAPALTVSVPASTTNTFSGPITSSGSLSKTGLGTLVLTGTDSYSGGTTVTAGTLQGHTLSLQGQITNNATLIFDQSFSGTFAGSLLGAGALNKSGSGTVTFNGSQTEGSTAINAGKILVASGGTLVSPTVTVGSGAELGGSGTIQGSVASSGNVRPGSSVGTLTIVGNYTQNPGSTFTAEVNPSTASLLAVTGTVSLGATSNLVVIPDPGVYGPGTLYTIITSGTPPITGSFSSVTIMHDFFSNDSVIYNPGSVQIVLGVLPPSNIIPGGNAGAIAACVTPSALSADDDLFQVYSHLLFLPKSAIRSAFEKMQPSQLKGLVLTEENNLISVRSTISQRLQEIYQTLCQQDASKRYDWTFWSNVNGDFLAQHQTQKNVGFRAQTGTLSLGCDRELVENLFVGVNAAYNYSGVQWKKSRGHGSINSLYLGPYASWHWDHAYVNTSLLGSWSGYSASRHIQFPFVNRKAQSSHTGFSTLAHIDFGAITYSSNHLTISPEAGLDYVYLYEQRFSEVGAGGLDLSVKSSQDQLLRSDVGLKFAKCALHESITWTNDLKLSWVHEQRFGGKHYRASFKHQSCVFEVTGMHPTRNLLNIDVGISAMLFDDRISFTARYDAQLGHSFSAQTATLQMLYRL
jgi:autotransporter-associated beta strand protein